jgi:hypothetical protein
MLLKTVETVGEDRKKMKVDGEGRTTEDNGR